MGEHRHWREQTGAIYSMKEGKEKVYEGSGRLSSQHRIEREKGEKEIDQKREMKQKEHSHRTMGRNQVVLVSMILFVIKLFPSKDSLKKRVLNLNTF